MRPAIPTMEFSSKTIFAMSLRQQPQDLSFSGRNRPSLRYATLASRRCPASPPPRHLECPEKHTRRRLDCRNFRHWPGNRV